MYVELGEYTTKKSLQIDYINRESCSDTYHVTLKGVDNRSIKSRTAFHQSKKLLKANQRLQETCANLGESRISDSWANELEIAGGYKSQNEP